MKNIFPDFDIMTQVQPKGVASNGPSGVRDLEGSIPQYCNRCGQTRGTLKAKHKIRQGLGISVDSSVTLIAMERNRRDADRALHNSKE